MTIAITKVGSKAKMVVDSGYDVIYHDLSSVNMIYNTANNTVDVWIKGGDSYPPIPIANLTISGTVITSQAVFDTQLALVFPDAGGPAITTLDDLADGSERFALNSTQISSIGRTGFHNADSGLKRWRQSLGMSGKDSAGTGYGGIDIACWGDSILEGYNGTDVTFDSAVHRLKVKLQERYNPSGVVGGYGYLPFRHGNSVQSVLNIIGTVNGTPYGGYEFKGGANGTPPTKSFTGNNGVYVRFNPASPVWKRMAVDAVQYIGWKFVDHGNARWDIGVGAAPTIGAGTQTGTHSQAPTAGFHSSERFGTSTDPGFTQKISLTSTDDNYVQVVGDAGGSAIVAYDGLFCYNGDFTCGVRLHDMSIFGSTIGAALGYIKENNVGSNPPSMGTGGLTGGSTNLKLYIFDWITNDCGQGATPGTSLASFLDSYGQAIDYALGRPSKPSVLLIIPTQSNSSSLASRTTVGERYQDFVDGIYGLANARSNVAILDLWQYFDRTAMNPSSGQIFEAGWYNDGVHPSSRGQYAIGDLMYKMLTDT
jgi:hypothetical protein